MGNELQTCMGDRKVSSAPASTPQADNPLTIAVITVGSRGDVQPYLALCLALHQRGHKVKLLTSESQQDWLSKYPIEFVPLAGDFEALHKDAAAKQFSSRRDSNAILVKQWKDFLTKTFDIRAGQMLRACQGVDLIICNQIEQYFAYCIAQKLRIPVIRAMLQPRTPTDEFPLCTLPPSKVAHVSNRETYLTAQKQQWARSAPFYNPWRVVSLGLAAIDKNGAGPDFDSIPAIYAFSPLVCPQPADWDHDLTLVTGYWFLTEGKQYQPPQALIDFLSRTNYQDKDKPICLGWGSMTPDIHQVSLLIYRTLLRLKKRAILLRGWGGISINAITDYDPDADTLRAFAKDYVFEVDSVPHNWLFSHVSAVVHHGGAGTCAAALRAGIPQVITPVFVDQYFWADRLANLGVAPREYQPLFRHTPDSLANCIRHVIDDPDYVTHAKDVSIAVRKEQGLNKGVAAIERMYPRYKDMFARTMALSQSKWDLAKMALEADNRSNDRVYVPVSPRPLAGHSSGSDVDDNTSDSEYEEEHFPAPHTEKAFDHHDESKENDADAGLDLISQAANKI